MMTWMWMSATIALFGAELNAATEPSQMPPAAR
jgi:uncharacterized BrkB/YihY/UPF0761 family membrane protein